MQQYNKAIVALLTALVVIFGPKIPGLREALTPEAIQALATLIGAFLVYWIPNKLDGENVQTVAKNAKKPGRMTEDAVNPVPVDYIKGEKP